MGWNHLVISEMPVRKIGDIDFAGRVFFSGMGIFVFCRSLLLISVPAIVFLCK